MTQTASFLMCALLILVDAGCHQGPRSVEVDANFDPASARAKADRPSSTVVEYVSIPSNPALPNWVITVEPFAVSASGITSGSGWQPILDPTQHLGAGVAAQLLSALSRTGNVVVIDYKTYCHDPGKVTSQMESSELGPFVIKGTVTEFNETAELESEGEISDGSKAGRIMTHIPVGPVSLVGSLINISKGSKSVTETRRTGMVGLDIQIVDPTSGRLLDSFIAEGTFTAVSIVKARSKFGKTESSSDYASSAIGQAQRAAINNATRNIYEILSQTPSVP